MNKILEIGCGKFRIAGTFIAIDINEDSECDILADAHNLPFKSGIFTKVVAYEVMEHLKNPSRVLSEIQRVLIPHGHFEFSIPNAMYWRVIARWIIEEKASVFAEHINCWRLPEIQNLLRFNGFRILRYWFGGFPRHHPTSILMNILPRITRHSLFIEAVCD